MTDHSITLNVSDYVYDQAVRAAKATAQPIEAVLEKQLEKVYSDPLSCLPLDEQAELEALTYLSDETLWTIAREQMPYSRQEQMQWLMDRNNKGTISTAEYDELTQLVEQGQRLMLRKARAADLLMDRGYSLTAKAMSPLNE